MKKNKIIASFLVLALIVTLVAPSFALAATPDTSNIADAKTKAAADKLVALGVFVGDDNGDLGIEDNFTRAQFATVISRIAGFENAAKALGNQATGFSDVPANHWGSGYIAAATARGYLKGDTAGTFRPDADISYAEALTVLMRILGYKDEFLPGTWPANFMVAGDQVGLIGDDFVANVAIARGAIMKLTSEVIEKDIVAWDDKKLMFVEVDKGNATLLKKNFDQKTDDKILLNVNTKDKKVVFTDGEMKFAEGFNGAGLNALRGHDVKVIKNDENQVVGIADAQAANKMVVGKAEEATTVYAKTTASAIKVAGNTYNTTTNGAIIYKNGESEDTSAAVGKNDAVTLFFTDKDKKNIRFVIVENFTINNVVKSVGNANSDGEATISFTTGSAIKINKNTVYTVNGNEATLADIKKNFVLDYVAANNVASKIVAYDKAIEGKVTSKRDVTGGDVIVTVNGVNYKLKAGSAEVGTEYTFHLNGKDEIYHVTDAKGVGSEFEGLVVNIEGYRTMNDKNQIVDLVDVTLVTKDGNVVTYQVDDKKITTAGNVKGFVKDLNSGGTVDYKGGDFQIADIVKVKLEKNKIVSTSTGAVGSAWASLSSTAGDIAAVTKDLKADANTISVTGTGINADYALGSDVVVFDLSGNKQFNKQGLTIGAIKLSDVKASDIKVATLADIKKDAEVSIVTDKGVVKYIVMYYNGKGSEDQLKPAYGVFKEYYTVKEDGKDAVNYIVLNVDGQDVTYKATTNSGLTAGKLAKLADADKDGKYENVVAGVVYQNAVVEDNTIKISGTNYIINNDTKFVTVKLKTIGDNASNVFGNGKQFDSISIASKEDVTGAIISVVSLTNDAGTEIKVNGSDEIAKVVVIYKKK